MKIDTETKYWSAYSDEIHCPEGIQKLNEFYKEVDPNYSVELIDGKAVLITGGQNILL